MSKETCRGDTPLSPAAYYLKRVDDLIIEGQNNQRLEEIRTRLAAGKSVEVVRMSLDEGGRLIIDALPPDTSPTP